MKYFNKTQRKFKILPISNENVTRVKGHNNRMKWKTKISVTNKILL